MYLVITVTPVSIADSRPTIGCDCKHARITFIVRLDLFFMLDSQAPGLIHTAIMRQLNVAHLILVIVKQRFLALQCVRAIWRQLTELPGEDGHCHRPDLCYRKWLAWYTSLIFAFICLSFFSFDYESLKRLFRLSEGFRLVIGARILLLVSSGSARRIVSSGPRVCNGDKWFSWWIACIASHTS